MNVVVLVCFLLLELDRRGHMITQCKSIKGFTLIELLIVVAIIGILAAIAIPQFSAYRSKAYNGTCQSDLHNIRLTLEMFYGEQQRYPF